MAIYTKTGDKGTTSLFDGQRVKKYSDRVDTYGTFDECNACISVAAKFCRRNENVHLLEKIQYKMFQLAGEIATADTEKFYGKSEQISELDISSLEDVIDRYTDKLPKITSFILPGTSVAGAHLHLARTVCRRGERMLVRLSEEADLTLRPELLKYVNRLSDCLYIIARDEDCFDKEEKQVDEIVKRYIEQVGE
ncbi:cob(I)yrinic acid a,c-diamide adenosyltransferase [Enterococcus xiangfangensis]|uniref:Corrinoid adenosyltransferase n=1 Tax=Enterococcus xiangfangensis TaxID=1296537 RepID=A0ABU3FA12_9ENTE|nr:cob(I)yrinic acid a,c-diamide adenosyltransferase [Enterococcus xiangfangensis]MBM7711538.1 ATP:cob(I)alamin adenosyltransferase [Enterococcus xiangfangensis]MDT2759325.1 cob(I)yrinic acid a,c-diamide adenosyltransferase [Enterococcus xiangfangensis]NBK09522.1 cob(I)yrinic acid a,c-diamide adenosyltransferase [Enterococcus asini]